jgi:hypothetical protein
MRQCTIALDGAPVVEDGQLIEEFRGRGVQ